MKKLIRLLTACIASLLLVAGTAFSSFAEENSAVDEAAVIEFVESILSDVSVLSNEELEAQIYMYESNGYTSVSDFLKNYQSMKGSLGEYQSCGEPSSEPLENGGFLCTVPVTFSAKKIDFVINFSPSGDFTFFLSDTAEPETSLGSKMKEAGINLVVGMGTVFIVLIFLCWIISLFGNISRLEKKFSERKASQQAEKAVPAGASAEVLPLSQGTPDEDEIQAVIAAAIAAYEAENGCTIEKQASLNNGLIIKTYRRK